MITARIDVNVKTSAITHDDVIPREGRRQKWAIEETLIW
jgi:hypothetical protein